MARSRRDLVVVQRGPRRVDEIVCRAVDQPQSAKASDRVERVRPADVFASAVTDKLIDCPRALIVWVEESDHDAPIVRVVRLDRWVRLLLHRKVLPFGATVPGQLALSPGPISRMPPNLRQPASHINEFRYSFRRTLLVGPVWASRR